MPDPTVFISSSLLPTVFVKYLFPTSYHFSSYSSREPIMTPADRASTVISCAGQISFETRQTQ